MPTVPPESINPQINLLLFSPNLENLQMKDWNSQIAMSVATNNA